MGKKLNRRAIDNIKFSIGAKLILIISIVVVVSLGSITALVSYLVYQDLRIMAEESNFEANRNAAIEAETIIINTRSHSRLLIQNLISENMLNRNNRMTNNFFEENIKIAAVYFVSSDIGERTFINNSFFSSRNIDYTIAENWFKNQRAALGKAMRGETAAVNAASGFGRPMLGLFFPVQVPGRRGTLAAAVLFCIEDMSNNFGYGINLSYMINSDAEVLIHSDFSLMTENQSLNNDINIKRIIESHSKNSQFISVNSNNSNIINRIKNFFANNTGTDDASMRDTRAFTAYTKLNSADAIVITAIEYNKVFEGIYATTRRNIYLTIAVLCLSIIFIRIFSKSISEPLKELAKIAREIEGGNFRFDIQERKAQDEIGVLSLSFQKMGSALNIFGKFTNKEIAVKAMRGQIKPGGLPKHATIFFSDIREFTSLSENFTKVFGKKASDKIVYWLNDYLSKMVECVEKTNGVVDKFIGDAVMAHWGTATTAGTPRKDAFNCVTAALMMRKALYYMNKKRIKGDASNPPIRIGCGINTGIVTAGQIGSDLRMEYTVIGDPVNLASRIEALTKPLGADILISEDTYKLLDDVLIVQEMPSVTVKGKEKPVRIFAVINVKDQGSPKTLDDVRKLLGIKSPNLLTADVNAEEKKYKIGE